MVYRKEEFINDEIYHVVLRGVDNNEIFKDTNDYYRGIFSIYEFNNIKSITIQKKREACLRLKKVSRGLTSTHFIIDKRDKIVDIILFCFMPNHIHISLKQLKNEGITKFMIKLGTGYAGYFNRKYNRKGHLFQNTFSSVHVENDNQLRTLFTYNHTNPISIIEPKWKEIGIKDPDRVIKFLEEEYRWSSYFDYIGKKNFPSVTERKFLSEVIGDIQGCKENIDNWVRYKAEIEQFPDIF